MVTYPDKSLKNIFKIYENIFNKLKYDRRMVSSGLLRRENLKSYKVR
jgi:hypothetical protein